jgi:hypothetical protein
MEVDDFPAVENYLDFHESVNRHNSALGVVYTYSLSGINRRIEDLVKSISRILFSIRTEENIHQAEFNWLIVANNFIPLIKFGTLRKKYIGTPALCRFFLKSPKIVQQRILCYLFDKRIFHG